MEASEIRVGFVTYAKDLHFYNVKVMQFIYGLPKFRSQS